MLKDNRAMPIVAMTMLVLVCINVSSILAQSKSCSDRRVPGIYCETCSLLVTCVQVDDHEWMSIPLEACNTEMNFYCDAKASKCSNTTGACLFNGGGPDDGNLFPCNSIGIFPDPYDCEVYHTCYMSNAGTLISAKVDCPDGRAFNAATRECTLSSSDPVCRLPQYDCTQVGTIQPWPSNNNYYYVCKSASTNDGDTIIYPELYRCNDGDIFVNYVCIPDTGNNGGGGGGGGSGGGGSGGSGGGGSGNNGNGTVACTTVGLIADPFDCRAYYHCTSINGVAKPYSCGSSAYFNANAQACRMGDCPMNNKMLKKS